MNSIRRILQKLQYRDRDLSTASIDGKDFAYHNLIQGVNPITTISIGTFKGALGKSYIDSIGFSWDDHYNVGDNFEVYKSSYYGTFDWRYNTIAAKPNGWEVHNFDVPTNFRTNPIYSEEFSDFSNNWDLYNVNDKVMKLAYTPSDDAFVDILAKDANYGDSTHLSLESSNLLAQTITVFNHEYSNWDHPAISTINIPDLPIESCILELDAYSDPDEYPITLRAIGFYLDWRGGAIGAWRLGPGQVRGDGTIRYGQEKSWEYDMSYCRFAKNTSDVPDTDGDGNPGPGNADVGSVFWNFIPQYPSQESGYFSPGEHIIKAFVTSQDAHSGSTQDSWISIKLHFMFKEIRKDIYLKKEIPYLTSHSTDNSLLDVYVSSGDINTKIDTYSTSDFSENIITWKNRPAVGNYLDTSIITNIGWNQINLGSIAYNYYCLKINSDRLIDRIKFFSSEYGDISKRPIIHHSISKKYQGNGVLYCQTNITEILNLRSPNNLNLDLKRGDKIEITFKTTSSNEIRFNLYDPAGFQDSFIISEDGNSDFNTKTLNVYLNDDTYLQQMEFTGLFYDTKYLIVESIKIYEGIRSGISIVDRGENYGKVAQISDRSSMNDLWMENQFENQFQGTIEFWIMSSDCYDGSWRLTFWNYDQKYFEFLMYENKWKYSKEGDVYVEIFGCGTPVPYNWYHVRFNFNSSSSQFKIFIDNIESNPIEPVTFDYINKIRFTTKKEFESLTWIDAIGYSWDDFYQIGDNQISLVIYPEKTNIQFSAADSTDTESDFASLAFYWDFGDGTAAFGKYVSHDYLISGRYNVTLYCKDDNGAITPLSQIIEIYNLFPEVNLTSQNQIVIINEGETIAFNAQSWDEITDFAKLNYSWSFDPIYHNILDFNETLNEGWRISHLYTDDYDGKVGVLVKDSEGDYNYDFMQVFVKNIDPYISIYDSCMVANVSFEVERSSLNKYANFTFELRGNDLIGLEELLVFNNSQDSLVSSNHDSIFMSLSKNWKIIVNSTDILPENAWFKINIHLVYLDGEQVTISSGKLFGGDYGYWSLNLDPYWVNLEDNTFKHPITFNANIWDPSVDDISLNISYNVEMLLELNTSNTLPLTVNLELQETLGDVVYQIEVYEENNIKFARIHASQIIFEEFFSENSFPTDLDVTFDLFPIIDLTNLLVNQLGLQDLEILNFMETKNYICGFVSDDDGGKNEQTIVFDSIYEFQNLSPFLEILAPNNDSIDTEISFVVKINDFDQLRSDIDFDIQKYIEDNVPEIPEEFSLINGTLEDSYGDLHFQDDSYIIFKSEYDTLERVVFFDDFNDASRDESWNDEPNHGKIEEESGTLNLRAKSSNIWGPFGRWFLSWAPYCTIPISKFSEDNWEVSVNISNALCTLKRRHYGLILYEDEKNFWMFGPYDNGKLKVVKIFNGEPSEEAEITSNSTYLKIMKYEGMYSFQHSTDNENWMTLLNTDNLEINLTDVGVFHRAYFWTCEDYQSCKQYREFKHCGHCKPTRFCKHHTQCRQCRHCCRWKPCRQWVSFDDFLMKEQYETARFLNFTSTLNLENLGNEYLLQYLRLYVDYKTDFKQLVNVSLFNFASETWELIDSSYIGNSNHKINLTIPSFDYFDDYNNLIIRFEAVNTTQDFQLYLDQLRLEYCFSFVYNYRTERIPYSGAYVPEQADGDLFLINGTINKYGDLWFQDVYFTEFESDNNLISFIAKLKLENAMIDDKIEFILLSYSLKTNFNQLVNLSIYNYTSEKWILLESAFYTEFTNRSISLPSDQSDLFWFNEILLKFETVNYSTPFELYLDQLKVMYEYLPYHLISNNIRLYELNLDRGEEDYTTYNSFDDNFEFIINMPEINNYKIFDLGVIYYDVKSNIAQEMFLMLYNFTAKEWVEVNTFVVTDTIFYNGIQYIENKDFVSKENNIKIKFIGTAGNEYELHLQQLGIIYKWSEVWGKYGFSDDIQKFLSLGFISDEYNFLYFGNTSFYMEGDYLITITADDGFVISRKGKVLHIFSTPPYATIGPIPYEILEDKEVQLTSELKYYGKYAEETRFEWSFGDGTYAYERNPTHSWSTSGIYDVSLTVYDCFGNSYTDIIQIIVEEQPPEIVGPFTFYGIQGQAIILDLEVFDSFYDEMNLAYEWYSLSSDLINPNYLFSTDKKPTIFLDWGKYTYSLRVIDSLGYSSITNITIEVEDIPPIISISNYAYWGNSEGSVLIKAYVFDSYMEKEFTFNWTIQNDLERYNYINHLSYDTVDILSFNCRNTTIYKGDVSVIDSRGKSAVASFSIESYIDSNGNVFSDEFENQLKVTGKTLDDCPDSDSDGYIDAFEDLFGYDPYNPDMDGDGLYDGFHSLTRIGELTYGTDPTIPDSDGDMLEDGFEVFGWNITVNSINILVSSNPVLIDTDNDGINDYEEFLLKLDPRTDDTDNDGLKDSIDPFPLAYDADDDGLNDFEEFTIGTSIDNADTDGDGLTDGQEVKGWHFKTNPLSQDSDHDFLADNTEIKTYETNLKYYGNGKYIGSKRVELKEPIHLKFEESVINASSAQVAFTIAFGEFGSSDNLQYGIEEIPDLRIWVIKDDLVLFNETSNSTRYISHAFVIRDKIENSKNPNFYGDYIIMINNTEANCILEDFKVTVGKYLDPMDDDYDNDGILDGVETQLIVEGIDKLDFQDTYYYDNLTVNNETQSVISNEFSLEISSIGRVSDAELLIEINSDNVILGNGNITIELIKDSLNNSIADPILIKYADELNMGSIFYYQSKLELSDYYETSTIEEYYGKYVLRISIIDDDKRDNFTLSEFYIETNTWIQAGKNDWEAWITDPAKWSTDKDKFSDKYEIDHGYNPQSEDTDGDGVWDNEDVDPLHNLIIEVSFISGSGGKHLEGGFKMKKDDEDLTIWTTYNDGSFGHKYYIDINDDRKEIDFEFYLYDMHHIDFREIITFKRVKIKNKVLNFFFGWLFEIIYKIIEVIQSIRIELPDTKLGQWDKGYNVGTNQMYNLQSGSNKLNLKVSTKPLSRANTIAIYEINSTFNGHYESQEKMNVFHLHVKDDGAGTPFVNGINTVVIPTSLFQETKLNALIQKEKLDYTPLKGCEFSSIERDELSENEISSENIDFIIIQTELTSSEALSILNLLLEVYVNDSTGETEFLYNYISKKEDYIEIEQMNVNIDILSITPYISNYQNSAQGDAPKGFWEAFLANLENLANLIISIIQSIVELVKHIVDAIASIAMAVLSFLADLIWLLIRAAILILAFIMLGLEIFGFIITLGLLLVVALAVSAFSGKLPELGFLFLKFEILGLVMRYEAFITWIYLEFFDITIPKLLVGFYAGDALLFGEDVSYLQRSDSNNSIKTKENKDLSQLKGTSPLKQELQNHQSSKLLPLKISVSKDVDYFQGENFTPESGFISEDFTFRCTYLGGEPQFGPPKLDLVCSSNLDLGIDMIEDPNDTDHSDGIDYYVTHNLQIGGDYKYRFYVQIDQYGNNVGTGWLTGPVMFDLNTFLAGMIVAGGISAIGIGILGACEKVKSAYQWIIGLLSLVPAIIPTVLFEVFLPDDEEATEENDYLGQLGLGIGFMLSGIILSYNFIKKSITKGEAEGIRTALIIAVGEILLFVLNDVIANFINGIITSIILISAFFAQTYLIYFISKMAIGTLYGKGPGSPGRPTKDQDSIPVKIFTYALIAELFICGIYSLISSAYKLNT